MFKISSHEELSLMRMRHAFRSSGIISAFVAAAFLIPLLIFSFFLVQETKYQMTTVLNKKIVLTLVILTIFILFIVFIWLAIDHFLNTMSVYVALTCAAVSVLFLLLFSQRISALRDLNGNPGSLSLTFTTAYTIITAYVFFVHAGRVWLLQRNDRKVLARVLSGDTFWHSILTPLPFRYGHQSKLLKNTLVAIVLSLAKVIHGVTLFVMMFAFGAFLFTVTMWIADIYAVVIGRTEIRQVFNEYNPFVSDGRLNLIKNIVLVYAVLAVFIFVFVKLTVWIKCIAQWLIRATYEQLVKIDNRNPILFLRSFADDQVTLPSSPFYFKYWLAESRRRRLDHELVERFSKIGPVVAVGRPGEKNLPFGAARRYVQDSDWKRKVIELAESAVGIVIVADDSPGIEWEIRNMLTERFVEKTLFLANPNGDSIGLNTHTILGPLLTKERTLFKDFFIVGAHRIGKKWKLLTSKRFVGDDFVVCCLSFFRRDSQV